MMILYCHKKQNNKVLRIHKKALKVKIVATMILKVARNGLCKSSKVDLKNLSRRVKRMIVNKKLQKNGKKDKKLKKNRMKVKRIKLKIVRYLDFHHRIQKT